MMGKISKQLGVQNPERRWFGGGFFAGYVQVEVGQPSGFDPLIWIPALNSNLDFVA